MSKPRRRKRKINGILLLDKPIGFSSNQALLRVRALYEAEKAGHTGSLDPLATGLLPICLGQATKLCGYLLDSGKRYLATVRFGEKTETGDIEGAVTARSDARLIQHDDLLAVLPGFTGVIQQVPPMFSALKHQGLRLYDLAREGVEVVREPRAVTIHALDLVAFETGSAILDIRCSKGTYIRTLAEDIAAAISQCAHLTALRRIEAEPFSGSQMITLEQVEEVSHLGAEALDRLLLPTAAAVESWPRIVLDSNRVHYLRRGQALRIADVPPEGDLVVFDTQGNILCLAQIDANGLVAPRRWLADDPVQVA